MARIRLFHWNSEEALPVLEILRRAGFEVDYQPKFDPGQMRAMRQSPPGAVVIDLSRLPSHGREIATALRGHKLTRQIPILFLDGVPEKVDLVRNTLPDAAFCQRPRLAGALRKCIADRPENPVVPTQMMERYAGRTTAQKLGIGAGAKVAVINAPRDYAQVIGALPDGVDIEEKTGAGPWAGCKVVIWFVEEPEDLMAALPQMRKAAAICRLWVAWPKKAARKDSLLNENLIREMGIGSGLVDYKVCSVNQTWSGLCFALKKTAKR